MIKASFTYHKEIDVIALKVKGHAGMDDKGHDIVCSAASILTYTIAQYLQYADKQNGLRRKSRINIKDGDKVIAKKTLPQVEGMPIVVPMKKYECWSPENPKLYDVEYIICDKDGKVLDKISSYLGMRKVHTDGNKVYLNPDLFPTLLQQSRVESVAGIFNAFSGFNLYVQKQVIYCDKGSSAAANKKCHQWDVRQVLPIGGIFAERCI